MPDRETQPRSANALQRLPARAALGLIAAYRYGVSPLLGPRCRFFPSCSEYTAEAIRHHGLLRGAALGALRICKCHPWHPGGYDPVPERASSKGSPRSSPIND